MRQAIIWTNVDPFHRRIYAAVGGDEFDIFDDVDTIALYTIARISDIVESRNWQITVSFKSNTQNHICIQKFYIWPPREELFIHSQTASAASLKFVNG